MRLIDAYTAAEAVSEELGVPLHYLVDVFADQPTVDAVRMDEVVRCKDCIHDDLPDCPMCYIENQSLIFVNHDPEFYCGKGERKSNG